MQFKHKLTIIGLVASILAALPVHAASINELTGQPVDASIANQRPIAVMVDNDARSMPHYGTADADIVYELVNSTANNRITRLMCLYKNWNAVPQIGNIRSTRPTNIMLAEEYNAVLMHDGGPFYNNPYLVNPANTNLSGGFTRVKNGKATEFTEYLMAGEAATRMAQAGIPSVYTANPGTHFKFGNANIAALGGAPAVNIRLPYANNKSQLIYNAATGLYDYYERGKLHTDAGTGRAMSFKNVIIQNVVIHQYDKNGYLIYNCIGEGQTGYYCTNGLTIPITWRKTSESDKTRYYYANGAELVINPGKTYITLCPSDSFAAIALN